MISLQDANMLIALFDACSLYAFPNRGANTESQRDSVSEPRVARHELPWETIGKWPSTPTGLRPRAHSDRRNPVGVGLTGFIPPRVARKLATLGL